MFPFINNNIGWIINSGLDVSFLFDDWLGVGPIRNFFIGPFSREDHLLSVASVRHLGFHPFYSNCSFSLPQDIILSISRSLEYASGTAVDEFFWKDSSSGQFSAKYSYASLARHSSIPIEPNPSWVWSIKTIPKIKFFFWQLSLAAIPTKDHLFRKGAAVNDSCPRCLLAPESPLHALRDCPQVRQFWLTTLPPLLNSSEFFSSTIHFWIESNATSRLIYSRPSLPWSSLFSFLVWQLWLDRNELIFRNLSCLQTVSHRGLSFAAEFLATIPAVPLSSPRCLRTVRWNPPTEPWIKLNCDGSSNPTNFKSGAGGVLRSHDGSWIKGYALKLGRSNSFEAETWGLIKGMEIALNLGVLFLDINCDASLVIKAVLKPGTPCSNSANIIKCCRQKLQAFRGFRLAHCCRESNRVADALAKHGADMEQDFSVFDFAPPFVSVFHTRDVSIFGTTGSVNHVT